MIRHVVLVRLRPDVGATASAALFERLAALRAVVPGFAAFAAGRNVSPEGLGRGVTHVFTCDFKDEAARDAYLAHPDHRTAGAALVEAAEGGLEGLTVVDFQVP